MSKTKAQPLHKVLGAFLSAYADRKSLLECTTCIAIHKEGARAVSLGTGIHASLHVPIPLEGDESVVVPATAFALGKGEEIKAIRAEFARPEAAPKWVDRLITVTTSAGRIFEVHGAAAQGTFPVLPAFGSTTHSWPVSKELALGLARLGRMSAQIELGDRPTQDRICGRSVGLLPEGTAVGGHLHSRVFVEHGLFLTRILGLPAEFAEAMQEGILSMEPCFHEARSYVRLATSFRGHRLILSAQEVEQSRLWPDLLKRIMPTLQLSNKVASGYVLSTDNGPVEQEASAQVRVDFLRSVCADVVAYYKLNRKELKARLLDPVLLENYPIALTAHGGGLFWSSIGHAPTEIHKATSRGQAVRYFNAQSLAEMLDCIQGEAVEIVFSQVRKESGILSVLCPHPLIEQGLTHAISPLWLEPSAAQHIKLPFMGSVVDLAREGKTFGEIVRLLGRYRYECGRELIAAHAEGEFNMRAWIEATVPPKALFLGVQWWREQAPKLRNIQSRDGLMKAAVRDTQLDEGTMLLCEWYEKAGQEVVS